jgi:hypothetical protein
MAGDDWTPPSAEGLSHPAELENVYTRLTATLKHAFDTNDAELFNNSMDALHRLYSQTLAELHRRDG